MPSSNIIYHVRFKRPVKGKEDYFFTSLAAIYDVFTEKQIGCNKQALWSLGVAKGKVYRGDGVTIRKDYFTRKKQGDCLFPLQTYTPTPKPLLRPDR